MCEKVKKVEDFFQQLPRLSQKVEGNIFYRGQSNVSYKLTPSILRDRMYEKEDEVYAQIFTECAHEFENSMSHNEILSRMQHYGVPTRLLDITTNSLVALYFACDNHMNETDGVVYVIKANIKDIKSFDSDSISILACLPRFTSDEKDAIKEIAIEASEKIRFATTTNEKELIIKEFNNRRVIRRLLHEIKKEKPAFEDIINPSDLLTNFYFSPRKTNPRIIRQSGAFIIFGLGENEIKIENSMVDFYSDLSYKIIIDKYSKDNIINQLACFGISKASLHPELYKVAEYLKDKYKKYGFIY